MASFPRVARGVGILAGVFAPTMLVPVVVALLYEPWNDVVLGHRIPVSVLPFLASFAATLGLSLATIVATGKHSLHELKDREAYAIVSLAWLVLAVFAALPFLLMGQLGPWEALFEAMSGLTTTGASAYASVSQVPKGLLFWRALIQWIGGIGIVVAFVAVVAKLTQGGHALVRAEADIHRTSQRTPTLSAGMRSIIAVYATMSAAMTVVLVPLLMRIGFSFKEAVYEGLYDMMTVYSTGGFFARDGSVGAYHDPVLEAVLTLFMFVGAANAYFYLHLREGRWRDAWRDPDVRFLATVYLVGTAFVVAVLWFHGMGLTTAVRGAGFSTATALTTTGYATADYTQWPVAAVLVILFMMLIGGNPGSTSGAIKSTRFLILLKLVARRFRMLLHPRAVVPVRIGGRTVKEEAIQAAVAFTFVYVLIWILGSLVVTAIDPSLTDMPSGLSVTASTLGTVGVGIGVVGPTGGYAGLTLATKIVLTFLMWLGRLEIFTVLLLFNPSTWDPTASWHRPFGIRRLRPAHGPTAA